MFLLLRAFAVLLVVGAFPRGRSSLSPGAAFRYNITASELLPTEAPKVEGLQYHTVLPLGTKDNNTILIAFASWEGRMVR